jgi:hypothetical protein
MMRFLIVGIACACAPFSEANGIKNTRTIECKKVSLTLERGSILDKMFLYGCGTNGHLTIKTLDGKPI